MGIDDDGWDRQHGLPLLLDALASWGWILLGAAVVVYNLDLHNRVPAYFERQAAERRRLELLAASDLKEAGRPTTEDERLKARMARGEALQRKYEEEARRQRKADEEARRQRKLKAHEDSLKGQGTLREEAGLNIQRPDSDERPSWASRRPACGPRGG